MLLAPLLYQLPARGTVAAYADNALLLSQQEDDVVAMTESLRSALRAHPAGQLRPKISVFPVGGPIEFLGHDLRFRDGTVLIKPSPKNLEKFERRAKKDLAFIKRTRLPAAKFEERKEDLIAYVRSWTANFGACDGMAILRDHWLAKIEAATYEGSMAQAGKSYVSRTKRVVFWMHPDQEEIVTTALDCIKEESGTKYQTVALEYLAQSYLGHGIAFKDWRRGLIWARKQSDDPLLLAEQVSAFLSELCLELQIKAAITLKASGS